MVLDLSPTFYRLEYSYCVPNSLHMANSLVIPLRVLVRANHLSMQHFVSLKKWRFLKVLRLHKGCSPCFYPPCKNKLFNDILPVHTLKLLVINRFHEKQYSIKRLGNFSNNCDRRTPSQVVDIRSPKQAMVTSFSTFSGCSFRNPATPLSLCVQPTAVCCRSLPLQCGSSVLLQDFG